MITLCTLFDHNYLDKGLSMYESLDRVCDEFELYVLAMSDRCYQILTELNYPHIKPIKLVDFEDEELLRVKQTRKVGEYCWTCSSSLIRYVLMNYKPAYCTYIDADLYFYSDPQVLIDEMEQRHSSVLVVGHRFNKSEKKLREWRVGKYCVEYNTFKNDINIWRKQCLDYCSTDGDGIHWGDQKYLDCWCDDYSFCVETELLGAGVAPWNIAQYKYVSGTADNSLKVLCNEKKYSMIFYHFENIVYLDERMVNIGVYTSFGIDEKLVNVLYLHYLRVVDEQKKMLKAKFSLDVFIKKHPGINPKNGIWKKIHLIKVKQ